MLRRLILTAALLLSAAVSYAYDPAIRDISIEVRLRQDGQALVTERWDVTVASGTEWYLVKGNLGAVDIFDLSVMDENGRVFENIGKWDVDASIRQKAGRCGLNPIRGGYELCWGVGEYGPHVYTVSYRMTDAIDLYDDYDAFHFQLVSPGLSSRPRHVGVRIYADGTQLDTTNVRAWGFGFEGELSIGGGEISLESAERFRDNSSVIALVRFDKGIFSSGNSVGGSFGDHLDKAMEGADFKDDDDGWAPLVFMLFFVGFAILLMKMVVPSKKNLLGMKPKDVPWFRDVPAGGDMLTADAIMVKMRETVGKGHLSSAMMLRMIQKNVLSVRNDSKGKVEFVINPSADLSYMSAHEKEFFHLISVAAGKDSVLQDKEFSRWANLHTSALYKWSTDIDKDAAVRVRAFNSAFGFTPAGQKVAREVYGFRKFLSDFTLVDQRQSQEATVWQDYLVYAALFGIADKVAKEMKDIRPDVYQQMSGNTGSLSDVIWMTNHYGNMVSRGVNAGAARSSGSSGMGGHTSFGGGGGFHGGGFGGGSR